MSDVPALRAAHQVGFLETSDRSSIESGAGDSSSSIESGCGAVAVGSAYLFPPLWSSGASIAVPLLHFHAPHIEPNMQISGIRLAGKTSRFNHPDISAFPEKIVGPAYTSFISRLARHSLELRSALPLPPIRDTLYRRPQPLRHLHDCSGYFWLERWPGETCTHWKITAAPRRAPQADIGAAQGNGTPVADHATEECDEDRRQDRHAWPHTLAAP